jgi:D-lactate dehydrogenase (cytochrome)
MTVETTVAGAESPAAALPAGAAPAAFAAADFLQRCRDIVGAPNVLTEDGDTAAFLAEWRGRYVGRTLAVLRPADTQEVALLVAACAEWRVPIVPQGGQTGLVLGGVPDRSGHSVVLSLTRMNKVRQVDPVNLTITVDAGCILQSVQEAAAAAGCLFPLALAAQGSCTIGGNLSTNAGGTGVLRYGNTRDLCLGLEVVTPQGQVWNGLRGLRKDNTGYDLRDLYIGAEGTLGVITGAVMKLYPQPKAAITALVALDSPRHALRLLSLAQDTCAAGLTGFELMSGFCMGMVAEQFPNLPRPFKDSHGQYVLMEVSSSESDQHAVHLLERTVEAALEREIAQDAVVATSIAQSKALWAIREHMPLAEAAAGKNIKHDISVRISHIADFIEAAEGELKRALPECQLVCFGHLGDGNLHFNVEVEDGLDEATFLRKQEAIHQIVYAQVERFGGSISAEHGIGALKRNELAHHKSEVELNLMRAIKGALDPQGIMNPGKVL